MSYRKTNINMQTKSSVIPYRICILLSFLLWAMALPAQHNYIRTYAPGWEYSPGTILDTNNSMVSTSYYDTAGRPVQTVKHSFTPQRNDMANFIDYDGLGRKIREWSYIPFNEADGTYKQRERFIESPDVGDHYVDYEYEPNAYHRITGEIGRNTSYKGVHKEYLFNTNTIAELSVWYFSPYSHYSDRLDRKGKYPDGSLACIKTTDEDGNVSYVFSDEQNRPVLERRMSDDGPCDTYYVYNDWDQLIAVLPPALIHGLSNSEQTQTYYTAQTNVFLEYAYLYKYDIQNHRVGVKLPGVDWHYTVYDGDHRPVLEQDGRQRLSNEWTFYKYDGLGRVILEGVFKGSTLDNMILTYADKLVKEEYTGNTSPTSFGYSENIIYPYPPTITKAYYYDTYDFLALPMFESELDYQGWVTKPPRKWEYPGTSLQTGSYVSCLEEPGYELCTFYYDQRARNTRTDKYNNVSRLNTRIYQSYGFLDEISQTHTYWKSQNEECYRRISNLYDHSNRLRTSFYYVNHEPASKYFKAVLEGDMLNYEYDEFGRVRNKILIDKKDTIRYSYDSRSRLEQIKSRNFSERLYYDKVMASGLSNSGPFNGQITGIQVKQGDNAYAYRLQYDKLNRLKESTMHNVKDTAVTSRNFSYQERMGYDRMGNINEFYQKIDGKVVNNIEIFHNGNRPSGSYKLSDYTTPAEYAHLAYGSCQGKDCYTYDASGNETSNLSDGIYYSHFNRLNLPDSVLFDKTGNTTRMSYMADGKRIRTVHKTYSTGLSYLLDNVQKFDDPIHTTEEIRDGDILFKDGIITRIDLPCGYINVREPEYDRMTAYYFVTDHLGSVRTTAAAISGKVVQQLEYTPGGTIWRSFDQNALQPKHFCGKEQLTVHGYNMYDSGKRFHTSNGIRFISIDPLAEKYYSWSPYVYCFDNPMRIIDPDGQDGWDVVAGYGIGLVTNIIPGSGALRDAYAPNDASDYNDALQGIDNASVLVGEGMIKTGGTGMAVGTGAVIIGTTATVGSGGTLAIGGLPVAGAGAVLIEAGAVTAGTGVVLMANGKKNQDAGYNRGKKNEAKSINQLNNDITKKKAPMGLKRFDKSHGKGGQEHVHFDNNSALNKDGSWKEGDYKLSNKIIDYLKENGWKINK